MNRHVSAVLFVAGLAPETFNQRTPIIWHNPWAANPVDPNIWRGPHARLDLVGTIIEEIDGLEAWEILGLNPRWPSEGLHHSQPFETVTRTDKALMCHGLNRYRKVRLSNNPER